MNGLLGGFREHLIDDAAQIIDLHGFGKEAGVCGVNNFGENICRIGFSAHEENWSFSGRLISSEIFKEMRPSIAGHMIIEKDNIWSEGPADGHTVSGIVGRLDDMVLCAKGHGEQLNEVDIVIDDQDFRHLANSIGSCVKRVNRKEGEFCRN